MRRVVVLVVGLGALACSGEGGGSGSGSGPSVTGGFGGCEWGDLMHLTVYDASGANPRDFICNDDACTVCTDGTTEGESITVYYQNQPITNEAFGTMNFDVVTATTRN